MDKEIDGSIDRYQISHIPDTALRLPALAELEAAEGLPLGPRIRRDGSGDLCFDFCGLRCAFL